MKQPSDKPRKEKSAMIGEIHSVLRKHLNTQSSKDSISDAQNFWGAYDMFLDDFWSKKEASIALERLSRSLSELEASYAQTPPLIRYILGSRASGLDWERREKYQKENPENQDPPSIPGPAATDAVEALEAVTGHCETLRSVVDVVRRELPEGIETRNRPREAWAVIHAAAEVCKQGSRINIPKAVAEAGPMYRLLSDLFVLFEIEHSVQGTYRGWHEHMYGKYEDYDLMQI